MHGQTKKNWETFVYFSQMKDINLRLSKNLQFLGITLPYVYYLYKKGYKYCN